MPDDMPDDIVMEVTRYRPEADNAPTTQSYRVPRRPDWTVLDGLSHIKDRLDGTLSYRCSCRMGICGSCGVTVNGEPVLGCSAFLADYPSRVLRVEPLSNFPVVRDLVVDVDDVMGKLPKVKPWNIRKDEQDLRPGEYLQTPEQRAGYEQYSMCIDCMLCYSVCPVYALDPDFLGPATIALGQRYNLDSRDQGQGERVDVLSAADGVWGCTAVGECTSVCPQGVDPAGAIQRYKLSTATASLKALLWPWGSR